MWLLIYRNEACIVINKFAGELSEHPVISDESLFGEMLPEEIYPVHRLDQPVTGCQLIACSKSASAFLGNAFSQPGLVDKKYWAIIEKRSSIINNPIFNSKEGELFHWIEVNHKKNRSYAYREKHSKDSKQAHLRYSITGELDNYLMMEISLITGRHHQIRAQLSCEGIYIKGDLKYGAKRSEKGGGIRLHAYSLSFPNPLSREDEIKVKTFPPFMDTLWENFVI